MTSNLTMGATRMMSDPIGGSNFISNHNFLVPSPDSITHPSATPTDYVAGTQIFSGVFVGTDVVDLTLVGGHLSWTSGTIYLPVSNTGSVVHLTEFVASVADFDGAPRTRGVSFALVGDEYRVTISVDALEDASAVLTPLGSVKFEQGTVVTRHDAQSAKGNGYIFNTVSDMVENAPPAGSSVTCLGYYSPNDGGGNSGVVKLGAHTEDGGSIFSIDANTYIESDLASAEINTLLFGDKADGTAQNDAFNRCTTYCRALPC
ncbi:hypothetical protein NVP1031O_140 [Vibrio phage 1.031.O._10N.261.46.F8]|nr:hypothetical protein NVP1031O_140 [Vibrio phage 1.031.O._10N.261.46.F8]